MNYKAPVLLNLKPKVAILDDDCELISDILTCVNEEEIEIIGFCAVDNLINKLSVEYANFYRYLFDFFCLIQKEQVNLKRLEEKFQFLVENRCTSVALIDLNLKNKHENEGFEICEKLFPYRTKSIIYSGSEFNEISLNMLNSGVISGQLSKSSDLFEEIIPTIANLNRAFLDYHFNMTHLSILKGKDIDLLNKNYERSKLPSINEEFLAYDTNINFLIKN